MKYKLYIMGINYDGTEDDWIKLGEYRSWRRLEQAKSDLMTQESYKNRSWKSVNGEKATCPFCGSQNTSCAEEEDGFTYGATGNLRIPITANVIVDSCASCGQQWTDHNAEERRSEAIIAAMYKRLNRKWTPVEEGLPDTHYEWVQVIDAPYHKEGEPPLYAMRNEDDCWEFYDQKVLILITHWRAQEELNPPCSK